MWHCGTLHSPAHLNTILAVLTSFAYVYYEARIFRFCAFLVVIGVVILVCMVLQMMKKKTKMLFPHSSCRVYFVEPVDDDNIFWIYSIPVLWLTMSGIVLIE